MLPGAPPPVLTFFVGRVLTWIVLTSACALPLMVLTWSRFTAIERFGEAVGVLVWTVVVAILAERLRWPTSDAGGSFPGAMQLVVWNRWTSREADRQSAMWRTGALVTAVIHGCLAIFTGPLGLFLWFAPAVWMGSPIARIASGESDFRAAFAWTLICGAQTAVVAWLCGRAFYRGQREKASDHHRAM